VNGCSDGRNAATRKRRHQGCSSPARWEIQTRLDWHGALPLGPGLIPLVEAEPGGNRVSMSFQIASQAGQSAGSGLALAAVARTLPDVDSEQDISLASRLRSRLQRTPAV
jgi:hypothetical protein